MEPVPASVVPGTRLGRYTLLGKLATGGMAEVFLARQDGPQGFAKTVVIKKILPHFVTDAQFVQMFLNEARLAALINHPNVVSIYELGEDPAQETYFMAMEYIDGCNLKRLAQGASEQKKAISPALAARVIADAASGLDFAHNLKGEGQRPLNIVHRDISPENILITYSGLVKVVDFGIAKAAYSDTKTRTGQIKGKVSYMSPEQVLGTNIDRRADVWALGVTLHWLLAGTRPFRGENEAQVINQILNADPILLPSRVPADLARIVMRSLSKDVTQRHPTGAALQGDLERWLSQGGQAVTASTVSGYMNDLFPETTDPDRLLTRAILSGELRQMLGQQTTPSQSLVGRPLTLAKTVTGSRAPKPSAVRRWAIGAVVLAICLAGGIGAWAYRTTEETPVTPVETAQPSLPSPPTPGTEPTVLPPVPVIEPKVAAAPAPPAAEPAHAERPPRERAERERAERRRKGAKRLVASAASTVPAAHPAAPAPAPAEPPPEEAPVGPPGRVVIRVLPWASVYVDGRMVGTTPFEPIELRPGKHKVELRNDELNSTRTLWIDVKSGETTTVQEKME
ncbi:MAG TPA: serine/threonine-protein kinase [Myxococcales bacterium]|nr:serine/threonine-protein kinase [Myxococcales bacterium]